MKEKTWLFLYISLLPLSLLITVFILSISFKPQENLWPEFTFSTEDKPVIDWQFKKNPKVAVWHNKEIKALEEEIKEPQYLARANPKVLSAKTDEKWVEVDLTTQKLFAHDGEGIIYEFPVSTGKWGRTPTGEFRVWVKFKYTLMHGGSQELGTYYYLPNVPYTQYFHSGYGLHGTYWHNNFGHVMSHGCVNMRTSDAQKLFYWTDPPVSSEQRVAYPTTQYPGTKVVVHGTPKWE